MGRKRKPPRPPGNCLYCGAPLVERVYYRKSGPFKGHIHHRFMPTKYCSVQCTGMAAHTRQALKARGRFVGKHGYVYLSPRKGDSGYQQPEHRAVMEAHLGRKLTQQETVHHRNGDRTDNRLENLELWDGRHGRGHRVDDEDIWSGMIPAYQHNAIGG